MEFLPLLPVRQKFPVRRLPDVRDAVLRELEQSGFADKLKPGARVAIGVGSRGISNISTIAGAVVAYWKSRGCSPFLFPAMGSHGAATAEGQADVLAHYGIHEATMGCPVVSALDVVPLGATEEGIKVFFDKAAYESDAVMLMNRVKWHTDFAGKLESGLFKMMAIGIGKFAGARQYHTFAYRIGLEKVIRAAGRKVLDTGKIVGGLAIIEDAHHDTAQVTAVASADMERKEEALLEVAKSWMGRIPMPLDILIMDEIGKTISGAGMDTKVVNRSVWGESNRWDTAPRIDRIFVRSLSNLSYGNAIGIGLADVIHDRVLENIDWNATLINSLTASTPSTVRIPIHFPSDKECLERIAPTVGRTDLREVRIGWIKNSLEIGDLMLSENMRSEIEANPELEITGDAGAFEFDASGNMGWFTAHATELSAADQRR
jgi:hypothetical protein